MNSKLFITCFSFALGVFFQVNAQTSLPTSPDIYGSKVETYPGSSTNGGNLNITSGSSYIGGNINIKSGSGYEGGDINIIADGGGSKGGNVTIASGQVGSGTTGTITLKMQSSGVLFKNNLSTTTANFSDMGDLTISRTMKANSYVLSNGTPLQMWSQSGSNISFSGGNVSVGTSNSVAKLNIGGTTNISYFGYGTDEDVYIRPGKDAGKVICDKGSFQIGSKNPYSKAKLTINCIGDYNPSKNEWEDHPVMILSGMSTTDYALTAGVSKTTGCSYIQSIHVGTRPSVLALNYQGGVVTIGSVSDFSKTDGYSLAVAGGVLAEKVVVKLQSNWPDYVFDNSHKVKSLDEIEAYIKAYKHLEGVPTATEVADKGIDVAEMNAVLLKKIEELTLLMIDQNKTIQSLQSKVNEIQK